jgi:hypothetical protein
MESIKTGLSVTAARIIPVFYPITTRKATTHPHVITAGQRKTINRSFAGMSQELARR